MGIRLSERSDVLCVPYGVPNDEGTPEATFVDLKAHPDWIPVIASCVGWPETRRLLEAVNERESPLMSLAADQAFISVQDVARPVVLTSFVTLCYADLSENSKSALQQLATRCAGRLDEGLQLASTATQRALHLEALFEVQPTVFRLAAEAGEGASPSSARRPSVGGPPGERGDATVAGSSLTITLAAHGRDHDDCRRLWGMGMTVLQEALR